MKHIPISDEAYHTLSSRHGDVAAFLEGLADEARAKSPGADLPDANGTEQPRSFADAMRDSGLLGSLEGAPADLSTNPDYLGGFGR